MRQTRLKLDSAVSAAYYHCMSRVVGREHLMGDGEKEVLRRQMWDTAQFCGLEILTYALMSNHYHVVLRVPQRREVSDAELLANHRLWHPVDTPAQQRKAQALEKMLAANGPEAHQWRENRLKRMFDLSEFHKTFKMRFSTWYNGCRGREGTFWAGRFTSVLLEGGRALETAMAYVDLNCVRAKIVRDPKDYRFCGYAEAVAGKQQAREGLGQVFGADWSDAAERYRCLLFGTLSDLKETKAPLTPEEVDRFVESGGQLARSEVLRCRIRYLVYGLVLGSKA